MIETDHGPTFVMSIGSGSPVVVVHGGPGFDHRYLISPLAALADRRRLVFYDQPGCGQTPAPDQGPSPEDTFAHCQSVLSLVQAEQRVGVIAHSWGALVLIAAFSLRKDSALSALSEGVLINPVPVTRAAWDVALKHFLARIPPERIAEFGQRLAAGDGAGAMAIALPYYTLRGYTVLPQPFALNSETYLAVTAKLGNFDYSAGAEALRRVALISGSEDFTSEDLIAPLVRICARVLRPPLGHFPFFEAPQQFDALISALLPNGPNTADHASPASSSARAR